MHVAEQHYATEYFVPLRCVRKKRPCSKNLVDLTREAIVKGILPDHAVTIVDINMVRIAGSGV